MTGFRFEPAILLALLSMALAVRAEVRTRPSYVGAQACGECHRDKYEGFRQTTHHLTSRTPDARSIAGRLTGEGAVMRTQNPDVWFEMGARDGGFFQTASIRKDGGVYRRTERIGVVIGSGKIAQTYLFWRGNQLFQLPVSYFSETGRWINSPGYRDGEANFSREILPRCLECHTTYFDALSQFSNIYDRDHFVLGISCERCHGPGGDHVAYHRAHPDDPAARFIVHPGQLEPQRQIDLCAQCHSGEGASLRPPFSFRPGEPLDEYIRREDYEKQNRVGVHSTNQLPRLSKSRCFQKSGSMTCVSCHDPHALERGNLALFSERCIRCHDPHVCGMAPKLGDTIRDNCIDCHMPRQRDVGTQFETADNFRFPTMRDHFITIYPMATLRFVKKGQTR